MKTIFRKIVSVSYGEHDDGPDYAIIELDARQVRRIRKLAAAVKQLKIAYIEDYDCTPRFMRGEENMNDPGVVTDKTTPEEAALLINDDNIVTRTLAKGILAGHSVHSEETFVDLCSQMTEWEGRTDCNMLQVSNDDIHYRGYYKHSDASWSTDGIPLKDLPKLK